jgi:KDO2-lipid IV(A) lauroyltransferase
MTRFEKEFGKAFPIVKFHKSPTIEQMASVVSLTDEDSSTFRTDSTAHQHGQSSVKHQLSIKQLIRNCMSLLPYPLLFKLTILLVKSSWVQKWFFMRFYRTKIITITNLLSLIETPKHSKVETIALSLLCIILDWRKLLKRFRHEEIESRVTVINHQVAKQAYQQGCGIIFAHCHYQLEGGAQAVFTHLGFSTSEKLIVQRTGDDIEQFGLERDVQSEALVFGYHIHLAQQSLKQGGVCSIAPDGFFGISEGITIPFYGRNRVFRTTFAELALSTGAKVICTFMSVDISGRIKLELFEPLDPGTPEQSHEARVEGLVRQYADWLGKIWAEHPSQIELHNLERHFTLPPAL